MLRAAAGRAVPALAALLLSLGLLANGAPLGADDDRRPPAYEQLRDVELRPAGHLEGQRLRVDRAVLELEDGELYLAEPGASVPSTGAVYLGRGTLRLDPVNEVERHQLAKFLDDAERVEEPFDRLVLRFNDDTGERLAALATPARDPDVGDAEDLWEDRRDALFEERLLNVDGRILLEVLSPRASPFLFADIHGTERDWFHLEIDPRRREEVRLYRYDERHNTLDIWTSFHRRQDYGELADDELVDDGLVDDGLAGPGPRRARAARPNTGVGARPSAVAAGRRSPAAPRPIGESWQPLVDVRRVAVDLSLDDDGEAEATARLELDALQELSALMLRISPLLQVTDVRSGSGEPLAWVQEERDRRIGEDLWEPVFVVQLPRRVEAGEAFSLEVAYEGELFERLRNRDLLLRDSENWYPQHLDGRRMRFDLTFRTSERFDVASGGREVEDRVEDGVRVTRFVTDEPVSGMAFDYGEFDEQEVTEPAEPGLPPITVYHSRHSLGLAPGSRDKVVGDIVDALGLYEELFGPYPFEALRLTETPALNGQSFGGFILLSFQTFGGMHTGESELFRTHELAHQWWGNAVDWRSYRDQWMSEGFAQYAAALHKLLVREDVEEFRAMMEAWRKDVLGQVDVAQGLGMRHYGFTPRVLRRSEGNESGSIWLGYRLNSSKTPFDYRLLAYEKGAYVLHMLRMMLADLESAGGEEPALTADDSRFRRLLRGFADAHRDLPASTEAFEEAVGRAFGEPMGWFFDQWVYGTDVPTYRPRLKIVPGEPGSEAPCVLRGRVHQEDVEDDFRMPVPVRLLLADGTSRIHRIEVTGPEIEVEAPLPACPRAFEFNYLNAVLADVDGG